MTPEEMLDTIADLQAHCDFLRLKFEEVQREIIGPEKLAEIEDAKEELLANVEPLEKQIANYTEAVKNIVELGGAAVKGKYLMAVYSSPRVTWDATGLEALAISNPAITRYRKVGKPSVSIRSVNK